MSILKLFQVETLVGSVALPFFQVAGGPPGSRCMQVAGKQTRSGNSRIITIEATKVTNTLFSRSTLGYD
jgi:hypothetical protein